MDKRVTRIFDFLPYYEDKFKPKEDVLAGKSDGKWVKYSIKQYREMADNVSYALLKLGLKKGDKIATIASSSPEWNFLDMGILQIGAIHVPIYPTISESDYLHILSHSEVKYVFISGKEIYRKINHILPQIPLIQDVYAFRETEGVKLFSELIALGRENQQPELLEKLKNGIKTDDLATIIYTSGTVSAPKGVMLSHKNILSDVVGLEGIFPVDENCKSLSYLPLCHVYERLVMYIYHDLGVSIYYAENLGVIVDNLQEIQPDIFTTVPRLLEKIYDKIVSKGRKLKGIQRQIFFWAVSLGLKYKEDGRNNIFYKMQLAIADKLVFEKWREVVGGKIRVIVSGGAALQPRLIKIFSAAKIPVLEGYGLTETSPVIAVNTLEKGGTKHGTVGRKLFNIDVKISDESEIMVKGPIVMQGYYKDPKLTTEVIDKDGWFHTGDLGVLEKEGHIRITGRIKEIFKTSMGKYISPTLLENKFKESPFIDSIMVLGENKKFAAALIVPNFDHLRSWCQIKGIEYTTDTEMIKKKEIINRVRKEVDKYNKFFGDFEQVKRIELIDHEWTVQSGELTANLKLRRNALTERYKEQIAQIYSE